ncbi:3-hydroxyacyl-CoA dehydrogenase NAD-binding domain-containing protein [Ideonella sp. DXS29W]|uniref:3-hydroxyacyl-CoA dehydrogenase NAD-binding domain-containing protein n=2 Tax=Ideonella lacteola TaxID=2984193 RepID=A0ABU9BVM1_9BURK
MSAIKIDQGADGVVLATMDLAGKPMNVIDAEMAGALAALVEALESNASITGLILASGKKDFFAGADVDQLWALETAEQGFEASMHFKSWLRRLEQAGKPVVAAIHGRCLGGGLEIAMACHHRIVLDDGKACLGLPEVKLGLLPGGGGTQRLPRLVGMQQALQWMGEGTEVRAAQALSSGLVQALAKTPEDMLAQARAWIAAHPKPQQPWDAPKFCYPGGDSRSPATAQLMAIAPSMASAKSWGNYPAITHIMSSVFEGGLVDFDTALQIESRYFAACVVSPESRNLIGTLWYQLNAIKKGASRPQGVPVSKVNKLGILGAGMMGAGIAYVAAKAGVEVVLLDTTQALADKGKAYSQGVLDKAVKKGYRSPEQREAQLARIQATTDYAALADCQLVIEAVFEDREVKAQVTQLAEAQLAADAVFASNTSTLPITGLAKASARPDRFIGLHFFSPVDKMPLVEIIVGEQTSDETLAKGFDFVQQIGQTPIVVNDSRGFYTSRVFATYVMEGLAMLKEGVHPRSIEVAGLQAGMPMPPLALQDEVSLSLGVHVADQTRKDMAAAGQRYEAHPGEPVLRQMCEMGRIGKKAGRGFYDWPEDGQGEKRLWPGLQDLFPLADEQPDQQEIIERLLYAQANEAARCLEEGVLRSVADGNVGSILGWGFAPFFGGALQFINTIGPAHFVQRSRQLAQAHGKRFKPAANIVDLARRGIFFDQGGA